MAQELVPTPHKLCGLRAIAIGTPAHGPYGVRPIP